MLVTDWKTKVRPEEERVLIYVEAEEQGVWVSGIMVWGASASVENRYHRGARVLVW